MKADEERRKRAEGEREKKEVETYRIYSLRIHAERAIERIKNFRLLRKIPNTMCPIASRLVHVCTFMTTLMSPLGPPTEETVYLGENEEEILY